MSAVTAKAMKSHQMGNAVGAMMVGGQSPGGVSDMALWLLFWLK